jgi:hypothetical protein
MIRFDEKQIGAFFELGQPDCQPLFFLAADPMWSAQERSDFSFADASDAPKWFERGRQLSRKLTDRQAIPDGNDTHDGRTQRTRGPACRAARAFHQQSRHGHQRGGIPCDELVEGSLRESNQKAVPSGPNGRAPWFTREHPHLANEFTAASVINDATVDDDLEPAMHDDVETIRIIALGEQASAGGKLELGELHCEVDQRRFRQIREER